MTRTRIHKLSPKPSPKPSPLLSLLTTAGALAVALLGALGTASTAHADATDDAFIAALRAHGVEAESNQNEIEAGHLVCHQLGMGKTDQQVATDVMSSSTLDGENAGYFVAVAERAYCPQYSD